MKNKSVKSTIITLIPFVASIVFTFFACLISTFNDSFIVDSFCFNIHNYNKIQNDTNPSILKVEKTNQNNPELYSSIYANYKYNRTINGLRLVIDNEVDVDYCGYKSNPTFFFQNTSSISNELDKYDSYSVDDGLFSSYFSPDELGNNYRSNRGSDCFAYISDSLAYKLINRNNVTLDDYSNEKESYLNLINSDEHILNLKIGGSELKCSINSVLYSNKRSASRINKLFGDFVLIFNFQFFKAFHTSVEFDLKQGMYANRNLINTLKSLGINSSEYGYQISSFDLQQNNYTINSKLTGDISKIMSILPNISINIIYWLLIIFAFVSYLIFGFFEVRKKKITICSMTLFIFFIFNIVANFVYIYYALTPPIIIFVIASIISIFEKKGLKIKDEQVFEYFEIGI